MLKVFIISGPPAKISVVSKYLKKCGFDVEETRFKEYLIVYGEDPSEALRKIDQSQNLTVNEVTDENYSVLTKKAEFFEFLNPKKNLKVGDAVIVISGQYEGTAGIVKELHQKTVTVSLTVWGLPFNAELPYSDVRKA